MFTGDGPIALVTIAALISAMGSFFFG